MPTWVAILILVIFLIIGITLAIYDYYIGLDDCLWSLDAADEYATHNETRSDLVVSLTTLPSRLKTLDATLKSLLLQDTAPKMIRVNIPHRSKRENCRYEVPAHLKRLSNVTFVEVDRDWGPATKAVPTLLDSPADQPILVVDDDVTFPRDFVTIFDTYTRRYPNAALTGRGYDIPSNLNANQTHVIWGCTLAEKLRVDVVAGVGGFVIKPRFFDLDKLINYDAAPRAAFFVDDLWFSGLLAQKGVTRYVIPMTGWTRHALIMDFNGLSAQENKSGRNDNIMTEWFSGYWRVNL